MRGLKYSLLVLTLVVIAGYAVPRFLGPWQMDLEIQDFVERHGIPGAALAVLYRNEIVYLKTFGQADIQSQQPVRPESLFRIASLSKPITATAVLKLVADGKIDLDTKVFGLLADFDATGDPRLADITVRHVLQHSGGWDREQTLDPIMNIARFMEEEGLGAPPNCEQSIRLMVRRPLQFTPGTDYAYSNIGYCVLGLLIERVTGQSYEIYVREKVLAPMGITGMRVGNTLEMDQNEVRYHHPETVRSVLTGEMVSHPYGGFVIETMPMSGGWIASIGDIARFVAATPPSPVATEPSFAWKGGNYYGLGWRVWPREGQADYTHYGAMPGSFALAVHTHDGYAFAVLCNGRPADPETAYRTLYTSLIDTAKRVVDWRLPALWP